jgi:hypothetical protein
LASLLQEQPVLSANTVFYGSMARAAEEASGVSFLLNRFSEVGFIDYNMEVHSSLLNVILHDRLRTES